MTPSLPLQNAILVLVTTGSDVEAKAIARSLVNQKLAACVNYFPIQSIYTWQGELQEDTEWQLLIKTSSDVFESLESEIKAMHSYDLPEIVAIPIQRGSSDYLQWISQSLKK